ncbi:MAG: hypothetical protein ABID84_05480 [Chloroflexota bacterium]
MSTSNVQSDQAWGALANATVEERERVMDQRCKELGALSEEERVSQMAAMARAEYALPEVDLRTFTLSRLRTWLKLDEDTGRKMSASYDAVMLNMPGQAAMRRVALVQTLARDFSREDQVKLVALIPNVFGGFTDLLQPTGFETRPTTERAAPAKKGWWPFGRG